MISLVCRSRAAQFPQVRDLPSKPAAINGRHIRAIHLGEQVAVSDGDESPGNLLADKGEISAVIDLETTVDATHVLPWSCDNTPINLEEVA